MGYVTYSAVTPNVGDNPRSKGWYEYGSAYTLDGTPTYRYFHTLDETVQVGKIYYTHSQDGFLIQIGTGVNTYKIPFEYIKADTFSCVWSVNDVESFRDGNGTGHRDSVLPNRAMKVEFETIDLDDVQFEDLMSNIRSRYATSAYVDGVPIFNSKRAKSLYVRAWMPEEGAYKEDYCYLTSNVNISIRFADENGIRYNPIRFAFIGYAIPSAT